MVVRTLGEYMEGNLGSPIGKMFGTPTTTYTCLNMFSNIRTQHTIGIFDATHHDMMGITDFERETNLSRSEGMHSYPELIEGVNAREVISEGARRLMGRYSQARPSK